MKDCQFGPHILQTCLGCAAGSASGSNTDKEHILIMLFSDKARDSLQKVCVIPIWTEKQPVCLIPGETEGYSLCERAGVLVGKSKRMP